MLITARDAAWRLSFGGIGRRQAMRVLAVGLAGPAVVTPAAHLFDFDRVQDLLSWPELDDAAVEAVCPHGVFVARRPVPATVDLLDPAIADGWDLSVWSAIRIRLLIQKHGFLPLVATVAGFVVATAEITDVRPSAPRRRYLLDLRQPGDWADAFVRRRYPVRQGCPWLLQEWAPVA